MSRVATDGAEDIADRPQATRQRPVGVVLDRAAIAQVEHLDRVGHLADAVAVRPLRCFKRAELQGRGLRLWRSHR